MMCHLLRYDQTFPPQNHFSFLLHMHTLSLRVSRCVLWLSLLEKSNDSWNIPCITCQRGWKLSEIYNNIPSEWCFYLCHLGLELSLYYLHFTFDLKSTIPCLDQKLPLSLFPTLWPPKWTFFFLKKRELQHLGWTVCLLCSFKGVTEATYTFGSVVKCSLDQTWKAQLGSFFCLTGRNFNIHETAGKHTRRVACTLLSRDI